METADYIIIGAGIIGLTIAYELRNRYPYAKIIVLEKEQDVAYHSSGRNSGVLHAGFYYNTDSLKAKFTRNGNYEMKQYCHEHNIPVNNCGKVVVTKDESELSPLYELNRRGKANGVDVTLIDEKELAEIEPNARTTQYALYSPTTATVDPVLISNVLRDELKQREITFYFGEGFLKKDKNSGIITTKGRHISAGMIINAAGLYADTIAKQYDFSSKYTIIPFKGLYLKYIKNDAPIRTNIYPVPNLKNPFLGVHYTVTVNNTIKIGPTSVPAFWRENYNFYSRFRFSELAQILRWEAILFLTNAFGFRNLAFEEMSKYNRKHFVKLATRLVQTIDKTGFKEWSTPGIRAQLLNKKTKELVQDFVVEGDKQSIHILNAVSPAFTSSFPFARWVVDQYVK